MLKPETTVPHALPRPRKATAIARLTRALLAAELLGGLLAAGWALQTAGLPRWPAIVPAAATPVLLHAWTIGLQSLAAAWHRRLNPGPPADWPVYRARNGMLVGLRVWLGETFASLRSYLWLMPWPGSAALPSGGDPQRIPVLLVHGYLCNRAVWRPMAAWLAARGHAIEAVDLEPPLAPIESFLPALDRAELSLRERTGASRIALLGHSMGGIAIRAWLRRRGSQGIGAVLTLGSPHQGTWSARFGIGRNVAQLVPGSAWLDALSASETPATRSLFTLLLSLHDNIIVPQAVQTLDGADHRVLAGLGHMELLHHRAVRSHVAAALDRATRAHQP